MPPEAMAQDAYGSPSLAVLRAPMWGVWQGARETGNRGWPFLSGWRGVRDSRVKGPWCWEVGAAQSLLVSLSWLRQDQGQETPSPVGQASSSPHSCRGPGPHKLWSEKLNQWGVGMNLCWGNKKKGSLTC